ncbi:MAG: hypothetical protein HC849_02780 [Oscillatoriales cyanobacterium RU_3_3]|nr:hypothetical protein [Oscillatoriales cyanobacterium RU_3_3]
MLSMPKILPILEKQVSSLNPLAVASFDRGSIILATIVANTNLLLRLFSELIKLCKPVFFRLPNTAATWPWGRERVILKESGKEAIVTPPFNLKLTSNVRIMTIKNCAGRLELAQNCCESRSRN